MAQTVEAALMRILDEYIELTDDAVEKSAKKTARDTVQTLRNTSPRRAGGGGYASGWTTKKKGLGTVVYNKTDYQLTHLLEKGHVIRNKYGTYGRAPAQVHIAPAEEKGSREFEENIRRELSK